MLTITRDRPTWRSLTAAALICGLALAGAGCTSPDSEQPSPPPGGGDSASRAPLLTFAVSAPATGINPATVVTAFSYFAELAYEPLVYYAKGGTYEPALAESWQITEGNTGLTMELRQDVKFSDGTPVNAEAVKASLDYCASDASINALALRDLDAVEVTGEFSLSLTLKQANPLLLNVLSQRQGCGMIISPAGLADIDNLTVDSPSAGAGAYIYDPDQSVPGDTYTYTVNPTYYDPAKQHFDKVVLKVIAESQAALNALTTGQVDVTSGDLSTAIQAASNDQVNLSWIPVVWTGLNLIDRQGQLTPALGDVRVRQAINYAIDRQAITTAILGDFGVPTASPSAEGYDGWTPEAQSYYSYDPDKAKQLLAEAGYANGFEMPAATVAWAGYDTLMTAIEPMLAAVGITLNVTTTADETGYYEALTGRQQSAVLVGYGSLPMFRMGQDLVLPEALPFNGFGTDDPSALALFDELRSAPPDQASAKAQALNTYLVENAWFAPVLFTPIFAYYRNGVSGIDLNDGRQTISVLEVTLEG
ncbi:MAG: ABC transporter substrate-binding protein [Bifidobacteriaceae bacterium]|nr:ABC transporter substrate-binding protein [Bifidobacteriaceae bacterium]